MIYYCLLFCKYNDYNLENHGDKMKRIFLISVFVMLAGCVKVLPQGAAPISGLARVEAKQTQFAAENNFNHISNDTNIRLISALPDKLGNWSTERERYVINYERRQHGLGYSKRYNEGPRRPIWADIYFFHARQTGMSDGIESRQFVDLWSQSIIEPSWVRTCDIKDKTDTIETFNNIKFRKCRLATILGGKEYEGLMFMTVFEGTFLKVRISYRPDYKNFEREIDKFMNDLANSLNKQRI
jgi:hypothetical protein